ncbi:DUF808 domain-containing protein [Kineococcus sp. G2]|uniref:DUF808 domain-containing protein n=1 Tax=Kineococcus sp. G2 TaxID=3127484 RepID=UPI00301DF646
MSGGLVALLDDVAVLARAAAASVDDIGTAAARAGVKAAGVVVDDTAVTPQYVRGLAAERELPIVRRIALGSLRNKLLLILPAVLLLSQFLPFLLTPILMLGGAYLCYEGAEKIWGKLSGHGHGHGGGEQLADEDTIVSGAVRTDFILSAEIMVISLDQVTEEPFVTRAVVLAVVAVLITALVYGVVGLIVKMDDVGLRLSRSSGGAVARLGHALVKGMPRLLTALTVVGTAAMLWVGGHILLVGADELGLHAPYGLVHHAEEAVHEATGALGGVLGWTTNTLGSALAGLVVGALVVLVVTLVGRLRGGRGAHGDGAHGDGSHEGGASGSTAVRRGTAHGDA